MCVREISTGICVFYIIYVYFILFPNLSMLYLAFRHHNCLYPDFILMGGLQVPDVVVVTV